MNRAYQMILIFFLAVSLASFSDYLLVQSLGIVVSPTEHRIYNSFDKKPHNLMEGASTLEGGGFSAAWWADGLWV